MHGPRGVAEVALELSQDRGDCESAEGRAALGVEAVDRLHERQVRDLDQVLGRDRGVRVASRQFPGEREEPLDQCVPRGAVAPALALFEQRLLTCGAELELPGGRVVQHSG